jgi:hypothetical protein
MDWKSRALLSFECRFRLSRPTLDEHLSMYPAFRFDFRLFMQMFHFFGDVDHKADPAYCCPFPKSLKLSNLRSFAL